MLLLLLLAFVFVVDAVGVVFYFPTDVAEETVLLRREPSQLGGAVHS